MADSSVNGGKGEAEAAVQESAGAGAVEEGAVAVAAEGQGEQTGKAGGESMSGGRTRHAAPSTGDTAAAAAWSGGPLGAPGALRPCPIPAGAVIFGELTSAFVDGPRLVRFLGDRRHTGAVVDAGGNRVQVVVLHDGGVLALLSAGAEGTQRLDGMQLPAPGAPDEHELSVLTYRPEVAIALGQLVNVPSRFERMHGSFVDFPALLTFLQREKASGAVRVSTREDTGVVLLRTGDVLGAYTRQKPELDDADVVYPLARSSDAEIDVHVGPLTLPPATVAVGSIVR